MLRHKVILTLCVPLLIQASILGCDSKSEEEPDVEFKVPVESTKVQLKTYEEWGTFYGRLEASEQSQLKVYAGGEVTKVMAQTGDTVKKGQSLCQIDGQKFHNAWVAARLMASLEGDRLRRTRVHVKRKTTSADELSKVEAGYHQKLSQLGDAKKMRAGGLCVSPIDGVVLARFINQWDDLNPGDFTFIVGKTDGLKLRTGIPEKEIDGYRVDSPAKVQLDGQTFEGKVTSVARALHPGTRTFVVEVQFAINDVMPRTGMTVPVRIQRFNLPDRIVLPKDAVLVLSGERKVMLVDGERAKMQPVEVEADNGREVLIKSGLKVGDQVITKGQGQATNGALIAVKGPAA